MALNWVMLNAKRAPVPLPNEMSVSTVDGAEIHLTIPDAPPTGSSSAGGSGGVKKFKAAGKVFLTDQRFIFTSESASTSFDTLSAPLHAILTTRFEQPTFGSNYLTFEVKPSPEGGLTEGTKVEVRFRDRAMFEFVSLLEKSRERAIYMKRQQPEEDDENLPSYSTPAESSSVTMVGGIPVENPPSYD